MHSLWELDLPEERFVDPDRVVVDFVQDSAKNDSVKFVLWKKSSWLESQSSADAFRVVLPSKILHEASSLYQHVRRGFNVFVFCTSPTTEIASFFCERGYSSTESLPVEEIPIDEVVREQISEFIDCVEWSNRVVFFAHDCVPVYILDASKCEGDQA